MAMCEQNAGVSFTAVDHVNVRVSDLERSVRFYTEILGFTYLGTRDLRPGAAGLSAYVQLGGVVIELASGHNTETIDPQGMINHFALEVSDLQAAYTYLKEKGVTLLNEPHPVKKYFSCFFAAGPSGERFEILQKQEGADNYVL